MPRIALIHATRVAIEPIETTAQHLWPEAETISILDESLSIDRRKTEELSANLWERIVGLARYAETIGPDGILFTCSAFGRAIDDAAKSSPIPIMKPNEAMFDAAFAHGDRVAMIHTFPPAAAGMADEVRQAAAARRSRAELVSYFCDGAMDARRSGDDGRHNDLVAATAEHITDADVILLAQFSMAGAADAVRKRTQVPVLSSPAAAITEIRRRIEAQTKGRRC